MVRRNGLSSELSVLLCLSVFAGCQSTAPPVLQGPTVLKTVPPSLQVPFTVERLAVLYPKTSIRELLDAYHRLEGAAFRLKEQRPSLRIVDRFELQTILGEQRFQFEGSVSEESAVRLGRLLGVDSVLLYRIEGPTFRDRVLARYYGDLPPFTVTSKIIMIESAEVVFHNVVTSPVVGVRDALSPSAVESSMPPAVRAALERGVAQTTEDLWHAFR